MELKVTYKTEEGIEADLDKKIEKALAGIGFKRWASGCDLTNGVRDLAFDDKE